MRTLAAIAALLLVVSSGCRRPDPGAGPRLRAELVGAWLREQRDAPGAIEGFDLRADGSIGLVGILSMNGIAWSVSRDELVISTNTDRYAQPNASRLAIEALEPELLRLGADPPDYLAGTWRRGELERVSGLVTWLDPRPLPADARIEVRLHRAGALLARALITPKSPPPIPFALSYLPATPAGAADDALEASIFTPDGPLFSSAEPRRFEPKAADVDLVVAAPR